MEDREPMTYSLREAALQLDLSRSQCYRLHSLGILKAHRIGRRLRVLRSELEAQIANGELETPASVG